MTTSKNSAGFSAVVQIELIAHGQRFAVSQMGRDEFLLETPAALPRGEGELVLTVDGQQQRWIVSLPDMPSPARWVRAKFRAVD